MDHNVAAGRTPTGHVAVCICGWRITGPDLETMATAIGLHFTAIDNDPDKPPVWAQEIFDAHAIGLIRMGSMIVGGSNAPMWGCNGDCSCFFVVDDGMFLDRYSFVNEDGACQGQDCPCHHLPHERPTDTSPKED